MILKLSLVSRKILLWLGYLAITAHDQAAAVFATVHHIIIWESRPRLIQRYFQTAITFKKNKKNEFATVEPQ